jgi:hypothetical protein
MLELPMEADANLPSLAGLAVILLFIEDANNGFRK